MSWSRRDVVCGGCAAFVTGCAGSDPTSAGPSDTGDSGGGTAPPPAIDEPLDNPAYPCDQPIEPGGEGWIGFDLADHPELAEVGGWIPAATASGTLYVVAHVTEGCYVAAERRCTHQGVIMDYVPSRGQLVCPRHASLFDWAGQVVGGPAQAPVRVYFAGRDGDTVWVKPVA